MSTYTVATPQGPLSSVIRPPGSRSHTNRAIVIAALANGPSTLRGVGHSEDTAVMIEGWRRAGVGIEIDETTHTTMHVKGCSGNIPGSGAKIDVAASGTTIRFLTAALSTGHGSFVLDGIPRMRERPIGDLVDALDMLGADVSTESGSGFPPVTVTGKGLAGGECQLPGSVSSQFLSALLMASPLSRSPVTINLTSPLVSRPFVTMTIGTMADFGVGVEQHGWDRFHVSAPETWDGRVYDIEPDAIAATYFWGAAAVTGGRVKVVGLDRHSSQGEVEFCEVLEKMGCEVNWGDGFVEVVGRPLEGVDVDMSSMPDGAMTLACIAPFAATPTTIRGVANMRVKESDRIAAISTELGRLGIDAKPTEDGFIIQPGRPGSGLVETYEDHRMAMSFAILGLAAPGITIDNPACVEKTFPNFFEVLEAVCLQDSVVTA